MIIFPLPIHNGDISLPVFINAMKNDHQPRHSTIITAF